MRESRSKKSLVPFCRRPGALLAHFTMMMHMHLSLAQSDFSTCELSDALVKLGVPHGGHIPDIHRMSPHSCPEKSSLPLPTRLCGPAYTVRMVSASDRDAPTLQQGHFIDLAPEGCIAFVSAPPGWFVAPSYTAYSHTPVVPLSPTQLHSVFRFDLI